MLTATQHLVCSTHRPPGTPPFDPQWRTETVMALSRGIVADGALDRLPILADALEEAGCDDRTILLHCRQCQNHTAHCWVLGDVFDRPPVPEPRRLTDEQVRRELERVTGRNVEPPSDTRISGFRSPFSGLKWVLLALGISLFVRFLLFMSWKPAPTTFQYVAPAYPATQGKR